MTNGDDDDEQRQQNTKKFTMRAEATEFVPSQAAAQATPRSPANMSRVTSFADSCTSAPFSGSEEDEGSLSEASEGLSGQSQSGEVAYREVRGQLRPVDPNRWMSPLEIHFSQMRARDRFRCDRFLEESVPQIRPVLCSEEEARTFAGDGETATTEPSDGAENGTASSSSAPPRVWKLEAPFPAIEILTWKCKLRDAKTGRPKINPETGSEVYDSEDRFFTLDNRRLYCLQRAAVSLWPDRAVVAVIELPPGPLARSRELRKFRTLDQGGSIFIGGRGEGDKLVRWSWRESAGLVSPDQAETDAATAEALVRKRPPAKSSESAASSNSASTRQQFQGRPYGRAPSGRNKRAWEGRHRSQNNSEAETGLRGLISRLTGTPVGGFMVFLGIYFSLRIATKLLQAGMGIKKAESLSVSERVAASPWTFAGLIGAALATAVAMHLALR